MKLLSKTKRFVALLYFTLVVNFVTGQKAANLINSGSRIFSAEIDSLKLVVDYSFDSVSSVSFTIFNESKITFLYLNNQLPSDLFFMCMIDSQSVTLPLVESNYYKNRYEIMGLLEVKPMCKIFFKKQLFSRVENSSFYTVLNKPVEFKKNGNKIFVCFEYFINPDELKGSTILRKDFYERRKELVVTANL